MKVYIGSQNPTKIDSVKNVFFEDEVIGVDVESKVSAQPFSDEETLEGAINRARESVTMKKADLGIGLEGGVMEIGEDLYLCNWGALIDRKENLYTASGARIRLPDQIKQGLEKGLELGEVMDQFTEKENVRKNEGAIGIFTNGEIERAEMFIHIVKLLTGQWRYDQ